jgi:hypothetical protein
MSFEPTQAKENALDQAISPASMIAGNICESKDKEPVAENQLENTIDGKDKELRLEDFISALKVKMALEAGITSLV